MLTMSTKNSDKDVRRPLVYTPSRRVLAERREAARRHSAVPALHRIARASGVE